MVDLLVVAWDGAPPEVLAEWADAGFLPVYSELRARGAWGEVTSTLPPVTAPAWASFHTGANPGRHGVFGWAARRKGSYLPALADGRCLRLPMAWELLSRNCVVGVVGFPLTYPAREVRGFWLPGFLAPRDAQGYPPGVLREAYKIAPGFSATPPEWSRAVRPQEWARELQQLASAKAQVALELARRFQPTALALHFQVTDTVQHYLWGREEVLSLFQTVDRALGELMAALEPRWVILLSDHGMGPVEGEFHVNTWLLREGFLRLSRRPGSRMRRRLFELGVTPRGLEGVGHRLYPVARRLGIVHSGTDLWARGPFARAARGLFLSLADVDWRRTWAYSHSEVGSIFLNRVGREPQGTVRPKDAGRVLRDLSQALSELRLPGGQPFLGELWRGEEIYQGEHAHLGPDLVFLSRGLRWMGKGLGGFLHREVFSPSAVAAGHRMEGVLLISGEGVRQGARLRAHLWDLAPTILALLGVPIPSWMDGRPIEGAFEARFLRPEYVSASAGAGQAYGEETVERLRGYGYL